MRRAILILTAWLMAAPALAEAPKARVAQGVLVGEATERAHIFRNIPFAAAPVGALRWAPPAPAARWSGERDATQNGPSCPQPMNASGAPNSGGANGPTSEDCLQLNIFAPKAGKKAPVMVWIHGGSHRTGAGWVYDGQAFARDGIVVVSINYRLGALGYFAHPALTKTAGKAPTGNFGLMDQIAALRWVKANIAAFGGDPGNVTVFGESAGGMSILALLATPSAKGLYHKAIVQSGGGWFRPTTLTAREQVGAKALSGLGVAEGADAAALRAMPADKLAALDGDYGPFTDGRLLRRTPTQALLQGGFDDVPLIIGANSGEDSLMGPDRGGGPEETARRIAFGDRFMVAPARWIAAQAAGGKPAWLYHFSYVGTRFRPAITRAAHAAEIQYVFEYWGRRTPMSVVSDQDRAMARTMNACWAAFARTGTPRCEPAWPAYDPARDELLEFGDQITVRQGFRDADLDRAEAEVLPTLGLGK
jgi:para-nitrobenzyl esterase